MKILIICTYYPPDTVIAAVRPYMFAKYLSEMGHEVTVLRSGVISGVGDLFFEKSKQIRVISYLGPNSQAELFEKGLSGKGEVTSKSRIWFLPRGLRNCVSKVFHFLERPNQVRKAKKQVNERIQMIEKTINEQLSEEKFDIVYSTYGGAENVIGGQYAMKYYDSKWVMDLRDSLLDCVSHNHAMVKFLARFDQIVINQPDAITVVSEGLKNEYERKTQKPVSVVYNGYEQCESNDGINDDHNDKILRICYTGQLYGIRQKALDCLLDAVSKLIQTGRICESNISLIYAGQNEDEFIENAKYKGLQNIIQSYGYVSREKTMQIQLMSDIFTVLSWNTNEMQGVLTGKFYEGIRARKPILAIIVGDKPDSELMLLNQKYNYGFCYESCMNDLKVLMEWIYAMYEEKINFGRIKKYGENRLLEADFDYQCLAKKLERVFEETLLY